MLRARVVFFATLAALNVSAAKGPSAASIIDSAEQITIETSTLEAVIRKKGYVTGVYGGTFLDKKTGFRDAGFGLDIVDWIMEPGSDEAYRSQLAGDLPYEFNNPWHGKRPKRSIEGPQICTKAKELSPKVIRGRDFVAVETSFTYYLAAPGKSTGSVWRQTLVFPKGARYFFSSDRIHAATASEEMFFRLDMPGHIKHQQGNTFSEVYLSYYGKIAAQEFSNNFAPDERFNYRRDTNPLPKRMIRAYHLKDKDTGKEGPWLAGMTLDPASVYEAWCHQRGYVCFIEEIGGIPIKPGESFGAAFIVGFFDSIPEMEKLYDRYRGYNSLQVSQEGWRLAKLPK